MRSQVTCALCTMHIRAHTAIGWSTLRLPCVFEQCRNVLAQHLNRTYYIAKNRVTHDSTDATCFFTVRNVRMTHFSIVSKQHQQQSKGCSLLGAWCLARETKYSPSTEYIMRTHRRFKIKYPYESGYVRAVLTLSLANSPFHRFTGMTSIQWHSINHICIHVYINVWIYASEWIVLHVRWLIGATFSRTIKRVTNHTPSEHTQWVYCVWQRGRISNELRLRHTQKMITFIGLTIQ